MDPKSVRMQRGTDELAVLECGGVKLDLRTRHATANGQTVELTAREFAMLATFLRHSSQVLSREQLLSHVWGYDYDPGTNVAEVYVGYLRRKLGDAAIETVRGMGYRIRTSAGGADSASSYTASARPGETS